MSETHHRLELQLDDVSMSESPESEQAARGEGHHDDDHLHDHHHDHHHDHVNDHLNDHHFDHHDDDEC